jgi:hypothetical protein
MQALPAAQSGQVSPRQVGGRFCRVISARWAASLRAGPLPPAGSAAWLVSRLLPLRPGGRLRVDGPADGCRMSRWQAHVQADLGTVAAGADLDQVAQLVHYP